MRRHGTIVAVCASAGAALGQCDGPLFDAWQLCSEYGGYIKAIATGDLDGDGDIDAVLRVHGSTEGAVVLLNDGTGRFTELPAVATPDTTKLVLADLDGDTDPDVIIDGNPIRFLINDGTGILTMDPTELIVDATRAYGDVDGDGDTDVVQAIGLRANVYEHISPLVFQLVIGDITYADGDSAELLDADGDSDLDLLLVDSRDGFCITLNDGTGVFGDAAWVDPDESPYYDLLPGDLDGDGDLDVIVTSQGGAGGAFPSVHLLVNDGFGMFSDAGDLPFGVTDSNFPAALFDVDDDGDLDFFDGHFFWYMNDGDGTFPHLPYFPYWGWEWTIGLSQHMWADFADLDNDGVSEFLTPALAGNVATETMFAIRGDRLAGPVDEIVMLPTGASYRDARAADADGDGDTDLIVWGSSSITVVPSLGTGRLGTPIVSEGGVGVRNILIGDFNLDGAADIASVSMRISARLNDGNGAFASALYSENYGVELQDGAAIGLIDGDSIPDILGVGRYSSDVGVWIGNGDGTFAAPILSPVTKTFVLGTALGDFDGDSVLDAALIEDAGRLVLLRGHNDGTFTFAGERLSTTPGFPTEAFDVDDDGDLDIVSLSNGHPAEILVLRNDGGWSFFEYDIQIGTSIDQGALADCQVFAEDINNDGITDLIVSRGEAGHDQSMFAVVPGDGAGGFGPAEVYRMASGWFMLAGLADADGDGDLDALQAGYARVSPNIFDAAVGIAFNRCTSPGCAADLTSVNAPVGDPDYGVPDGAVTAADIQFYVNAWVAHDATIADLTTQNAPVGDPGYGTPDGLVSAVDIQFYVNLWIQGCP